MTEISFDPGNNKKASEFFIGWHVTKVFRPQEKGGKKYQELLLTKEVIGQKESNSQRLRLDNQFVDTTKGFMPENLLAFSAYRVNVSFTPEGLAEPLIFHFLQLDSPIIKLSSTKVHRLTGVLVQDPVIQATSEGRQIQFEVDMPLQEGKYVRQIINGSDEYMEEGLALKQGDKVEITGVHRIRRRGKREEHYVQLTSTLIKLEPTENKSAELKEQLKHKRND